MSTDKNDLDDLVEEQTDKVERNIEALTEQFAACKEDQKYNLDRTKVAWAEKDWKELAHLIPWAYLGTNLQKLDRLWLYTFFPKWFLIIYLIV